MTMMFSRSSDTLVTDLDSELVLISGRDGASFKLNATGRCVWQALPCSGEAAAAAIAAKWDVPPARAAEDCRRVLEALLQAGLIECSPAAAQQPAA